MSSARGDVPRRSVPWWQVAVAAASLVAAAVAVWVTLEADFLAHPGWLAAQKADFILGPVFVGLYWLRRRPESRFGPLLLAFGAVGTVYILQSSSNPWLFGISLQWENVIYLCTLVLILTFPTGRLDGLAAKLIVFATVIVAVMYSVTILLVPQIRAENSISGCRALCPDNALAVTSNLPLAVDLSRLVRYSVLAIGIATAGLLIWRIVTGTPPQRRALLIGVPIALLFTSFQITTDLLRLVDPDGAALDSVIQWGMAGARSLIWYGFLFSLIAAQLFAGRTLHTLVRQSLRRPSVPELEAMLREPLGDPDLRLVLLDGKSETAADQPLGPGPGRREVTIVERGDGTPGAAIDHDAQLADDPELLLAAGAVALLAAENAELDTAWHDALRELRESRRRIVIAGDNERRKIQSNLHDGAQQRLVALRVRVQLVDELIGEDPGRRATLLRELGSEVDEALDEVRALARGVYPPLLADLGIVRALRAVGRRHPVQTTIEADGVGRYPPELERTVYFCCLEALQNAAKHASSRTVSIALADDGALRFAVRDDGIGFAAGGIRAGQGLTNMRDRLAAVGGELTIESAPGEGTSVLGVIPRL